MAGADREIIVAGRYRLGPCVGTGGMGDVFRAECVGVDGPWRTVALKRLRLPRDNDGEHNFAIMFNREVAAACALDHPNIASVFDTGHDIEGRPFLVMEFVDGAPLHELIRTCRMPPSVGVFIVRQVLNGLAHAHTRGIIHRDVSPPNVLVSRHGDVKLADFGLAKVLSDRQSSLPGWKGKMGYMAPELIQGDASVADARSDLYAVGAIFYELMTSQLPFGQMIMPTQYLFRSLDGKPRPPSLLRAELPPEIDALALRLLEREPANRFQCASEAIEAIDALPCVRAENPDEHADTLAALVYQRQAAQRHAGPAPEDAQDAIGDAREQIGDAIELVRQGTMSLRLGQGPLMPPVPPPARKPPVPPPARKPRRLARYAAAAMLLVAALLMGYAGAFLHSRVVRQAEQPQLLASADVADDELARSIELETDDSEPGEPDDTIESVAPVPTEVRIPATQPAPRAEPPQPSRSSRDARRVRRKERTQARPGPGPSPKTMWIAQGESPSPDRQVTRSETRDDDEEVTQKGIKDSTKVRTIRTMATTLADRMINGDGEIVFGRKSKNRRDVFLRADRGQWLDDGILLRYALKNDGNTPYSPAETRILDEDGNAIHTSVLAFRLARDSQGELIDEIPTKATGVGVLWIHDADRYAGQQLTFVVSESDGKRLVLVTGLQWD